MKVKTFIIVSLLPLTLLGLTKEEKIIKASLYPYVVKNIKYYPHKVSIGESKDIICSWYGAYFHGKKTALGETYDMYGYSAAHKTYPLGTILKVTNHLNHKSLEVRINDRGPFWNNRELDLSMAAAEYLGTKKQGVAKVSIEVISVPSIINSQKTTIKKVNYMAIKKVNYIAMSDTIISPDSQNIPIYIDNFPTKKKAKQYLAKIQHYYPQAFISKKTNHYYVHFILSSKEKEIKKTLEKLKKKGLITGYGLCWEY